MGLESSTSGVLSSDAQNRPTTDFLKQTKQRASSTEGEQQDVTRGGSLDGSRGGKTSDKGEDRTEGEAEAEQANNTRNGSLDNARST